MKTTIFLLFIMFILSINLVKIDSNTTLSECGDSIPSKYKEGVTIKIFNKKNPNKLGYYKWTSQTIELYKGCNKKALIHELAHHKNKMDGMRLKEAIKHNNQFELAEREIWQSLR